MKPTLQEKFVVTIGRRMGSGGRALGRKIAERLGITFYDKELLLEAAKRSGLCPEMFERNDERRPHFISGLFSFNMGLSALPNYTQTSISDDSLYRAMSDFIKHAAEEGSCVIVGRTADYILRDYPNVINVFVHADMDDCIKRICEREGETMTRENARKIAEKTNKLRAGFYNFYTDKRWGDSSAYDLTVNSSTMNLDDIADLVIEYVKRRLNTPKSNNTTDK